jgi:hypothetical protein
MVCVMSLHRIFKLFCWYCCWTVSTAHWVDSLLFVLRRCQNVECIASNGTVSNELRIGKDLEGSGCGLTEVPFGHLPGGTEENHERTLVRIAAYQTNTCI